MFKFSGTYRCLKWNYVKMAVASSNDCKDQVFRSYATRSSPVTGFVLRPLSWERERRREECTSDWDKGIDPERFVIARICFVRSRKTLRGIAQMDTYCNHWVRNYVWSMFLPGMNSDKLRWGYSFPKGYTYVTSTNFLFPLSLSLRQSQEPRLPSPDFRLPYSVQQVFRFVGFQCSVGMWILVEAEGFTQPSHWVTLLLPECSSEFPSSVVFGNSNAVRLL